MSNSRNISIDTSISSQINYWSQQRNKVDIKKVIYPKKIIHSFITLSREYGCGGYEIAEKVVKVINMQFKEPPEWVAYDKRILNKVIEDLGLSSELAKTLTSSKRKQMTNLLQTTFSKFPSQVAIYRKLAETVRTLASNGHVIIVGRAGRAITYGMEKGYHVRIVAPMDWKAERMMKILNLKRREAIKLIMEKEKERTGFLQSFIKFDSTDSHNYHIVINNAEHDTNEVVSLIIQGMKLKGLLK